MDPLRSSFQKTIDDVIVSITVGLNTGRSLGNDDKDNSGFERDRSSATAGWTVLCNDRAVIVGDKSRLTGWGDGNPLYHPQFAIITGIIEFRSKRADKLPVTTTKRALDTSSNVWLEIFGKNEGGYAGLGSRTRTSGRTTLAPISPTSGMTRARSR